MAYIFKFVNNIGQILYFLCVSGRDREKNVHIDHFASISTLLNINISILDLFLFVFAW